MSLSNISSHSHGKVTR